MGEKKYDHPGGPHKFNDEYCQRLIDHMANGGTYLSFPATLENPVCTATLYNWEKKFPQFLEAKKQGYNLLLLWDESNLNKMIEGESKGNVTALIFKMKNCHRWTDRAEIEQTTKTIQVNIDPEDAKV